MKSLIISILLLFSIGTTLSLDTLGVYDIDTSYGSMKCVVEEKIIYGTTDSSFIFDFNGNLLDSQALYIPHSNSYYFNSDTLILFSNWLADGNYCYAFYRYKINSNSIDYIDSCSISEGFEYNWSITCETPTDLFIKRSYAGKWLIYSKVNNTIDSLTISNYDIIHYFGNKFYGYIKESSYIDVLEISGTQVQIINQLPVDNNIEYFFINVTNIDTLITVATSANTIIDYKFSNETLIKTFPIMLSNFSLGYYNDYVAIKSSDNNDWIIGSDYWDFGWNYSFYDKKNNESFNYTIYSEGNTTYFLKSDTLIIYDTSKSLLIFKFKTSTANTELNLESNSNPLSISINPNPFNPSTTIKFKLTKPDKINLSVYDINGKLIKNLISETKQVGTHTINWNSNKYNSGTYIFKLHTGNKVQIIKGQLIK